MWQPTEPASVQQFLQAAADQGKFFEAEKCGADQVRANAGSATNSQIEQRLGTPQALHGKDNGKHKRAADEDRQGLHECAGDLH